MSGSLDLARRTELLLAIGERRHLPGILVECGVFEGDTALAMHRAAPHRPLHLFDTFAGLPALAENAHNYGPLIPGRFAADEAMVRAKLPAAVFHVGVFPDTLAGLDLPPVCVAHLDFDLEAPTMAALAYLYPRLVPGGVIVLDDVGNRDAPGILRALDASCLLYTREGMQAQITRPGWVV